MLYQVFVKLKAFSLAIVFLALLFFDSPNFLFSIHNLPDGLHDLPRVLSHEKISAYTHLEKVYWIAKIIQHRGLGTNTSSSYRGVGCPSPLDKGPMYIFHTGDRRWSFSLEREHQVKLIEVSTIRLAPLFSEVVFSKKSDLPPMPLTFLTPSLRI